MKVFVEPEVVAGLERGGEDLFLLVKAEHVGNTPPVGEELEVLLPTTDDYEGCSVSYEGKEDSDWVQGPVKFHTDFYEFEWEGTGRDVLALTSGEKTVEEVLRNQASWTFCHKPGEPSKLRCQVNVFVCGNAE